MTTNFSLALGLAQKAGYSMASPDALVSSKQQCQKCIASKCHGVLDYKIDTFDMQSRQSDDFGKNLLASIKHEDEELASDISNLIETLKAIKSTSDQEKPIIAINISLDRQSSILYQRRLIMEYELFLGCIGGILALFTGFSFIVIIEFIYFFTLRWWENWTDPELCPQNFLSNLDKGQPRSNSDPELT